MAGREWSVQLYLLVSSVLFKFLPKLIKIVCDLFEVCVTPAVEQRVEPLERSVPGLLDPVLRHIRMRPDLWRLHVSLSDA